MNYRKFLEERRKIMAQIIRRGFEMKKTGNIGY